MSTAGLAHDVKAAQPVRSGLKPLPVNRPGDMYEQEAERVSRDVMDGTTARPAWSLSKIGMAAPLQRECSCGGSCEDCKKKKKPEQMLQRDAAGEASSQMTAPPVVHDVLRGAGSPLDRSTRSFMESRFGHDFSGVRVFNDDAAISSARAVSANAYTVGNKIVFNQGRYAPDSHSGRQLLAHELAHVVQQQAAPMPMVQRAPDDKDDDDGPKDDGGLDEMSAALYSVFYSSIEGDSPAVLLNMVNTLAPKYEEAQASGKQPKSKLELASVLRNIYQTLKSDESVADRDADGALLASEFSGKVPWSKDRPHSLADVPELTAERIIAWESDAALNDLEQSAAHPVKHAKGERPQAPPGFNPKAAGASVAPPPAAQNAAPASQSTPGGGTSGGVTAPPVEAEPRSEDEKDAAKDMGSGPSVRHGLSVLQGRTLGSLRHPAAKEGAIVDTTGNKAATPASPDDKTPVIDACAQIWFLSNRLYMLDRTGHLQPGEESWVDVSSVKGMSAGGVYFLQPVVDHGINFRFDALEGTASLAAQIRFPHVLTSLIPMLDLNKKLANRHVGVGLIIDPTFAKKQQTVSDISLDKLLRAMDRVPGKMKWAVGVEINRIKGDPLGEVANQATAMGIEYASKYVPVAGQAMMMYQALELAQYLGDVGNVAAYAKTDDEIDIAAQAIARKLAQFFVFEAVSRGIKGGIKLGGGVTNKILSSETAAPEGAHVEPVSPHDAHTDDVATPKDTHTKDTPGARDVHADDTQVPQQKKIEGMKPETPDSPKAFQEKDAVAKAEVPEDPGSTEHHEIIATKEGMGRCSESPCPAISIVYAKDLAENPAFKARYEEIRKQGLTDIDGATEKAAGLAHDIEAARHAKANGTAPPTPPAGPAAVASPAAVAPPATGGAVAPEAKSPVATHAIPTAPKIHAIDDVLSTDRGSIAATDPAVKARFTPEEAAAVSRLDAAYRAYQKKNGADALTPEAWLKKQASGQPRTDAESLFGTDYGRVGKPAAMSTDNIIALKDIPRPAKYDESRLQADLKMLQGNSGTWDRLSALRTKGVTNGEISSSLLNIMKGNIGEVLARPGLESKLTDVRVKDPNAKLEFGTRVAQRNADGTFEAPKLFSDGLIVSESGGQLTLHDAFEIKAGVQGGAEATTQFFEWREGRLKPGDQLVLSDGRRFTYRPGKSGPGTVRGMMTATAHIVTTKGAEHLGTGSGDQVAAEGTRTPLSLTASELEYLSRLMFDSLPQTTIPVAPPAVVSPPYNPTSQ